jgi:[acyl-carrier-protein] S-malonyltransferase
MVAKNTALVFLFPGQGAQYPGMALDLWEASGAVKELFALASDIMGRDMRELLGTDAEILKRTDISQPALTLANLSAAAFLGELGLVPQGAAGFSLGEYAALAVAGVIGAEDCFRLVKRRGEVMQAAADRITGAGAAPGMAKPPGMAAVIGLPPEQVEALILQWTNEGLEGLYGANFNSPKQVTVSGTFAALAEGEKRFMEAGARRFLRLQVAGPFHSPLIADAAEAFAPALGAVCFEDPRIPLYSNVSGGPVHSGAEAKELALRQITCPVRWTSEEAVIASGGYRGALETGPGRVLQGLWKDSGASIPCYPAGTAADIRALAQET